LRSQSAFYYRRFSLQDQKGQGGAI
jgi:hypothetical protein